MLIALVVFIGIALAYAAFRLKGPSGPPVIVGPASPAEVQRLVAAGALIEAIKMYRALTGLGLYEAKQAIDRLRAGGPWEAPVAAPPAAAGEDVATLVREGKAIEAIKLYREQNGCDLLTAKQAIDRLSGH